ncbi:hypothetical protein PIROE2DRAFT_60595 [Piromyces sp. E2]|nr:hypothetical protein PIROE2DRAFT_60595 [Piromyces sp. E2]|eukprot:OUM64511.1 hypothetical protein PIROE2DRAFT_60595 [Piromyces sp. E2]
MNTYESYEASLQSRHWGYEELSGPEYWGDINKNFHLCKTGKNQSPINLAKRHLEKLPTNAVKFSYNLNNNGTSYNLTNNGHSIQLSFPADSKNTFIHDGIEYNLSQFHFHAPSEHHIENHHSPFEIHFVHTTQDENRNTKIHVVGIFAEFGEGDKFIDQFIPYIENLEKVGTVVKVNNLILPDLNELFNELAWDYEGSLTTPPCSEGVKWIVSNKVLTINLEQLLAFQRVMPFNARPTRFNNNVLNKDLKNN